MISGLTRNIWKFSKITLNRGYDTRELAIQKTTTKVKIEVKTRQHLVTTTAEKSKNTLSFTLTENEWKCADFNWLLDLTTTIFLLFQHLN